MSVNERLLSLRNWAEDNARNCIFPFWTSDYIVDKENGGFYGRVTLEMERLNDEPRALVLTGRMLYAFSTAYRVLGDEIYKEKADYTYQELVSRFYDKEFGGAYTTVTATGEVVTTDKPNYCEAFFIMGLAAYARATGDDDAKKLAMETFELMETKCKFAPGCYYGNMTRQWGKSEGMGFGKRKGPAMPEGIVMFPHHLCQAYVQLYKATHDERVLASLKDMIAFVAAKLYDEKLHNLKSIVDKDGNRVPGGFGSHQSFGHDCEISYLVVKVAEMVGDEELTARIKAIITDVLTNVKDHDFDPYGSMYNGCNLETGDKDPSHIWWAQAEAVTGMLCGYELTKDESFLTACEGQVAFIDKYFVNRKHGDWYNNILVDETGCHIVDGMHGFDKLNGGKCPFHNSQMCFEVMARCDRMLKDA